MAQKELSRREFIEKASIGIAGAALTMQHSPEYCFL